MFKVIKRCRVCVSEKLMTILSLGSQYLSDFGSGGVPKKYPLELVLCKDCNLLQLRHTVSKDSLYTERYGYRSGINNTMKNELKNIVKKVKDKIKLSKGDLVIDIGANDGTLIKNYPKNITKMALPSTLLPVQHFMSMIMAPVLIRFSRAYKMELKAYLII